MLSKPTFQKGEADAEMGYLRLDITYSGDRVSITSNVDLARTIRVSPSDLISSLVNLGEQNWEMVCVLRSGEHEIHYFKRPIE